ncbi:uncharacterized protein LOC144160637 [Haemaphysalis longicornis]
MLKVGKPPTEPASYPPVSLKLAAGKLIESTVMARLQWVADRCGVFQEQQSGFGRQHGTADSLGDVVSMLEQTRHDKKMAFLLLLDLRSAFSPVPQMATLDALDSLGVEGHLRSYVNAFLASRTLRVEHIPGGGDVHGGMFLAYLDAGPAGGLYHIHHLQRALDGAALLQRYRSRPNSRMDMLFSTYGSHIALPHRLHLEPPPKGTSQALRIATTLPGVRGKMSAPPRAICQELAALQQDDAAGLLQVYTDCSMQQSMGRAGAACRALKLGTCQVCSSPFPASSTYAELAGLHFATDLILELVTYIREPIILTNSRSAFFRLRAADQAASSSGYVERSPAPKLHALKAQGCSVRLHWLPSHVGFIGNEVADSQAKGAARQVWVPASRDVVSFDAARTILARVVEDLHPDARVVSGQAPRLLPDRISRHTRSLLLCLRPNGCNVGARLHHQGRPVNPTCADCPELETLEQLRCSCSQHDTGREQLRAVLQRLGAPSQKLEDLLFPIGWDAL